MSFADSIRNFVVISRRKIPHGNQNDCFSIKRSFLLSLDTHCKILVHFLSQFVQVRVETFPT